jgi:hypothetical protein
MVERLELNKNEVNLSIGQGVLFLILAVIHSPKHIFIIFASLTKQDFVTHSHISIQAQWN